MSNAELDQYGNPLDGSRVINCCYPDCGCDGAEHCCAENGASLSSVLVNRAKHNTLGAFRAFSENLDTHVVELLARQAPKSDPQDAKGGNDERHADN